MKKETHEQTHVSNLWDPTRQHALTKKEKRKGAKSGKT